MSTDAGAFATGPEHDARDRPEKRLTKVQPKGGNKFFYCTAAIPATDRQGTDRQITPQGATLAANHCLRQSDGPDSRKLDGAPVRTDGADQRTHALNQGAFQSP